MKTPSQTLPDELQKHELLGFGSAIGTGKNYRELFDFADKLPQFTNKKAFVFSASGMLA